MKTPEEILTLFHWSVDTEHDLRIINQIQKEAWNEAIEAAAENAIVGELFEEGSYPIGANVQVNDADILCVHKESILKLKK